MYSLLSREQRTAFKKSTKMGQANNNWKWLSDAGKWIGNKIEDFTSWVGGLGKKFNEPEREAALEDQTTLMQTQLGLNKEAAEHGHQLQKDMVDYTSPSMQIQRLKDAGLNPGLIYGAGGGVSGQSVGNQSTSGVSGGSSDAGARMMAKNQQLAMGLQLAKLRSEVDVNESVAAVNKANANKTAGVDTDLANKTIEDITSNIQNKEIQREGMLIDNKLKSIQAEIAEATQEWQIKSIERSVDILNEDYRKLVLNNNLTKDTYNLVVEKYILDNDNLSADLIVKASNNQVNDAKAKQILESVKQKDEELKQGNRKLTVEETRNIIQREINETTKRGQDINKQVTERGQDINKGVSERGQDIGQENALINAAAKNVTYGIAAQTEYSNRYKERKNKEPHKGKEEKTPWYKKTIGNTFGVAGY